MSYYITKNDSDVLAHHGILGQKWGVRRFQNEDGSLTDAGRKRYYKEWARQYNSDDQAYTKMPKDVDGMDSIKRLNDDISESLNEYKKVSDEIKNVMDDYVKNRDYWSAVSGVAVGLTFNDTKMKDLALRINTNLYDDTDQGYMNSAAVWAHETGKDKIIERLAREEVDSYQKFKENVETKVDDLLGKYGNKKIQGHATASRTMVNAIINSSQSAIDYSYYADDVLAGSGDKESVKTAKSIVAKLSLGKGKNDAWYLNQAVKNCGLDDTDFKDMTDSDWSNLSKELSRLSN